MLSRRSLLLSATLPIFVSAAQAATFAGFTQEAFEAAQAAGKPILVDITASWCPTCKAQKPIIEEITGRDAFKDMVVLHVDFDSQKDVVRSLGARMQSTLIVFRGVDEVARSVGETDAAAIEAQLGKAVSG
ncbi:MAG: thioredoxin family protein [Rhizobiales bacterium]|nr:thioredoxin family protein [Hyphomicrobiales bacterium]